MRRIRWSLALPMAAGLLTLAAAGDKKAAPAREPALAVLAMAETEPKVSIAVRASKAVALQFDLVYDPRVMELRGGTPSAATEAAGKQFTVRHLTAGRARVVVFGSHLNPLPKGELGTVRFRSLRRRAETEVFAVRRHAPDASGHAMNTRVKGGEILILDVRKEGRDENP